MTGVGQGVGIVVGMLIFYGVCGAMRVYRQLRISRELSAALTTYERHNDQAPMRVLFIGDSTGYGTGASEGRYSIPGRLAAAIPTAHIENASKPGVYLSYAHTALDTRVQKNTPPFDLIVIMLGGMNLVCFTPLALLRRSLKTILTRSQQYGKNIVLISPNNAGLMLCYPPFLLPLYHNRSRQMKILYQEVAHEVGVSHVSLFHEKNDPVIDQKLLARDLMHPNDAGYEVWYRQIHETLIRALLT
ncbi:MAG: GDSL-type esterase/lipase family protein [Patescibacteria group bacterium]